MQKKFFQRIINNHNLTTINRLHILSIDSDVRTEVSMLGKRILMECPLCGKLHEVEERRRSSTLMVKDLQVDCEETYYYCCNSKEYENEFTTSKLSNSNLLNAHNHFRKKKGYLTSGEIVELREKYGVSQVELSRLMGWGEATISRYESKAIQDEAYDNMLRLIKDDPLKALEFLEKNKEKFSTTRRLEIKKKILRELDTHGREFSARQSLKCDYVIYDDPSEKNGYTLLNIDKLESVISYYAEKISDLYRGKMLSMLWYADAIAYKQYQRTITGLVYLQNNMGVVPVGLNRIMTLDKVNCREEETIHGSHYLFMKHKEVDQSYLNEDEVIILDKVVNKFRDVAVQDLVLYMQDEIACKNTTLGDIISFELAKEIREFD